MLLAQKGESMRVTSRSDVGKSAPDIPTRALRRQGADRPRVLPQSTNTQLSQKQQKKEKERNGAGSSPPPPTPRILNALTERLIKLCDFFFKK